MSAEIWKMVQASGSVNLVVSEKPLQAEEVKIEGRRTRLQNKALHKYFSLLSAALNDAGIDMREFFKEGVEIPWSETLVKERIWRPVQEAVIEKESTASALTNEYSKIYEVLNRKLSEHGIHVPWPSRFTQETT